MKHHNVWSKPFPNQLGTLAAEKREESSDRARLVHIRAEITQALQDLVAMRARCQESPFNHAFAHLTDAKHYIERLMTERTVGDGNGL